MAINLVLDISIRSIYLFMWYPLAALCFAWAFEALGNKQKIVISLCLFVFACGNLTVSYMPCVKDALEQDTSAENEVSQWIEQEDYDFLYGEWFYAAKIASYGDGKYTAGSWFETPFKILPYINPQNIYSPDDNNRAVYLSTAGSKDALMSAAKKRGAKMTLVKSFGGGYELYESSDQLMYFK